MKKHILSLLLVLAMLTSLCLNAYAADNNADAEAAANQLYSLGLMKGTGTKSDGSPEFDLDGKLTREQAVTMLLRLMGKEEAALEADMDMPFTDVSGWAIPYVAYAYSQGLTNGTSATTFHGTREVSAAEYTTFVLRALGYSSETDFLWSSPWALSNAIGLTDGSYSSANNNAFVRGDMAIISADALDVTVKGSEETLAKKIGIFSATVDSYLNRVLSDKKLAALKDADLDTLQAEISTIGDAVAFLDQFTPNRYSGFSGEIHLDIEFLFDLHTRPEATFSQTYTAFVAWCITDDYTGIQYVISTGMNTGALRTLPLLALPVSGGFWIYSPHKTSTLLENERTYIVDVQVDSLEDLEEKIILPWSDPNHLQIFIADANQQTLTFRVDDETMWAEVNQGNAEIVYAMSEEEKSAAAEQRRAQQIETNWENLQRNWNGFGFPDSFAPTLRRADVEALISKDFDTVSSALKTVGDVMYYLALSGYDTTDGDIKVWDGDGCWSFNDSPLNVFANNAGNCGGTAAFVPALLSGDYDEAGCLSMTGSVEMGGGHVITYVQDGNTCYVFDSRALVDFNYTWNGGLSQGRNVVEAGCKWRESIDPNYVLIFAYPTTEGDLPGMGIEKTVYLPEQYRDRIKIVYEAKSEGYSFSWRAISEEALAQIHGIRNPMTDLPGKDVVIDTTGSYMTRVLTDEQLEKLKYATAETLQAWISTVADAVAYLDQFNPMYDAVNSLNVDNMLNLLRGAGTSPDIYTFLTGWFLADDYPDTQYLLASGTVSGICDPWIYHSLLLPDKNGYRVINPAQHSEHRNWVMGFDEMTVSDLDSLCDKISPLLTSMDDDSELVIYNLFSVPVGSTKVAARIDGYYLRCTAGKELYCISEAKLDSLHAAEQEEWNNIAKNLNVSDYNIPAAIGATTLTYEEAFALVGQDPAIIASRVKTVGDVLQYMIAARFGYGAPAVYTPWYGFWGFDAPGDVQLEQNYGCCCGGFANTVSYLLRGDYDKVGTLRWIGGGNHTISWVYTGGKYYVFDFTQYCAGARFDNYNAPVTVLTSLEDYYSAMPSCYPKDEIKLIVAFEADAAMYPSNWADPPNFTGLTFPAEAEGNILTIYQSDRNYGVKYEELTIRIPGWNYNQ